jgi:hypothetical protein
LEINLQFFPVYLNHVPDDFLSHSVAPDGSRAAHAPEGFQSQPSSIDQDPGDPILFSAAPPFVSSVFFSCAAASKTAEQENGDKSGSTGRQGGYTSSRRRGNFKVDVGRQGWITSRGNDDAFDGKTDELAVSVVDKDRLLVSARARTPSVPAMT